MFINFLNRWYYWSWSTIININELFLVRKEININIYKRIGVFSLTLIIIRVNVGVTRFLLLMNINVINEQRFQVFLMDWGKIWVF